MEKEEGRERERKKERVKKGNVVGYTRLAWKTLPTLRPAGLKERKRGKKRKKERKVHLLAVLHLLTYDYIDICSRNRFPGQISI